jgi:hypothetical protein|tara:strand:- start:542 stop:919 length:378 start_codon:yes stop_codon:yes gene_type:complete
MILLAIINFTLIFLIDSSSASSLPESYFGEFRFYINEYFFFEIITLLFVITIFLFKKSKIQLNVLRFIGVALVFGLINLLDERSFQDSFKDPGLYYFIISLILIFMTFKGIKKDQAIISSSNRLR